MSGSLQIQEGKSDGSDEAESGSGEAEKKPDTKVKTSENTTKEIQDFKKGDEVLTIFGKKRVIETYEFENKDIYEIEFEDGSIVKCSKEHKFLIDGKWIDAETIMDMVQSTKDININVSDIFGDIDVYKKQIYENLFSIDREKKKTYD